MARRMGATNWGDSLHDVIAAAMEKAAYVAVILGDNYSDSGWARDELKQALARERRTESSVVLPLILGSVELPAFLEDKVYLDFRHDYYAALRSSFCNGSHGRPTTYRVRNSTFVLRRSRTASKCSGIVA